MEKRNLASTVKGKIKGHVSLERPFSRRAKQGQASPELRQKLESLLAQSLTSYAAECCQIATAVLGALTLTKGADANNKVSSKALRNRRPRHTAADLRTLLNQLVDAAPQALSARVVMDADGSLRKAEGEDPRDQRAGLHSENQTVIYPSEATRHPLGNVLRLYS